MATKTLARWPRVGEVLYQALPFLRFFAYKIRTREKVRKGEGEPGGRGYIITCLPKFREMVLCKVHVCYYSAGHSMIVFIPLNL